MDLLFFYVYACSNLSLHFLKCVKNLYKSPIL